jgi:hypothetical protein
MSRAWFVYNIPTGDPLDSLNYAYTTIAPTCASGTEVCAVLGIYDPVSYGNHPRPFTVGNDQNLASYITNAQASGTPQPTAPNTPYAFVKA